MKKLLLALFLVIALCASSVGKEIPVVSYDLRIPNGVFEREPDPLSVTGNDIAIDEPRKFSIGKYLVSEDVVYSCMDSFIYSYKKNHLSDDYCSNLLNSFTFLIDEDGSNIEEVLFFLSLCSVESNFDQFVPTKYGVGISQVVYRVHKKYIMELGVSKENFYRNPKWNIYVGFKIFGCYLKSCNWNFHKTATRYNGNATKGYADHVTGRFRGLISLIEKEHLALN